MNRYKDVKPETIRKVKEIRARNKKISEAYRSQRLQGIVAIVIGILTAIFTQELLVTLLFVAFGLWLLLTKDILFYIDLEVDEDDLE